MATPDELAAWQQFADNIAQQSQAARDEQSSLARAQMANQYKIAEGGWAVSKKGIEAQLKIAHDNLQFQYDQMAQIGVPTLELDRWYKQEQIKLAQSADQLTRANLALEFGKFASTLRGPENYFQFEDWMTNTLGGKVPEFLRNLKRDANNQPYTPLGDFGAPAGVGALNPITMKDILGNGRDASVLGVPGQSGGGAGGIVTADASGHPYSDVRLLNKYASVFAAGAHRLAPGTIENMPDEQKALMQSAADKLGVDLPRWLEDYQRSRYGGDSSLLA